MSIYTYKFQTSNFEDAQYFEEIFKIYIIDIFSMYDNSEVDKSLYIDVEFTSYKNIIELQDIMYEYDEIEFESIEETLNYTDKYTGKEKYIDY